MLPDSTQEGEKSDLRSDEATKTKMSKKVEKAPHKKAAPGTFACPRAHCGRRAPPSTGSHRPDGGGDGTLLRPLRDFVDTPRELIEQSFMAIGKEELAASLPSILQTLSLDELKRLCLEQLELMPRNEVLRLLAGEVEPQPSNQCPDSTSTDQDERKATDTMVDSLIQAARSNSPSPSEALELFPATEDMELLLNEETGVNLSSAGENKTDLASNLTKMRMEILELELRARAIKALLQSYKGPEEEKKEIPSEIPMQQ